MCFNRSFMPCFIAAALGLYPVASSSSPDSDASVKSSARALHPAPSQGGSRFSSSDVDDYEDPADFRDLKKISHKTPIEPVPVHKGTPIHSSSPNASKGLSAQKVPLLVDPRSPHASRKGSAQGCNSLLTRPSDAL